jgi:hypothetical protein
VLQVFLTYTPRVNAFFAMEAMVAVQVARVAVCMIVIYTVVEIEKALVDPVLMVRRHRLAVLRMLCTHSSDSRSWALLPRLAQYGLCV